VKIVIWMVIGALAAISVMAYFAIRPRKKADATTLRKRLLRMVHDNAVVDRLLDKERSRFPGASEIAILRKVIKKLERDRKK
jgi:hypothetical protein